MFIDLKGNFLEVDSEYSRLIGYTREELLTMSLYDLVVPETRDEFSNHIKVAHTNAAHRFESLQCSKGGTIINFSTDIQYLPLEKKFCLFMHDITEHKLIESRLKRSFELLKFHVDNSPLATIEFDNNFRIISWSEKAENLFGWNAAEVVGKKIDDFKWVHEEDVEKVVSVSADMLSGKRTSNIHLNRNYRKDGSVITCEWFNSAHIDSSGNLESIYSLVQDITDQKRTELEFRTNAEKFQSIFSQSPIAIELYDSRGKLLEINNAGVNLFGIINIDQLKGFDLFNDPNFPDGAKEDLRRGVTVEYEFDFDFDLVKRNKLYDTFKSGHIYLDCLITPWMFSADNPSGYLLHVRDITAQKKAELQLAKYTDELKNLNLSKDKLFSIIAHDLRSPFQGLLSSSRILLEDYAEMPEEDKISLIGKIQKLIRSTYGLLDNLLEWANMHTNNVSFSPAGINLLTELSPTILLQKQIAENKKINMTYIIDDSITVKADKNMIQTVVRNLLYNSIKFTDPGGSISLEVYKKEDFVHISVSDNGRGMEKESLKNLFNLGRNVSTRGTEGENGTGLGLIICREMVEKHGGTIWAESEKGKGSKFCFTVPSFSN